MWDRMLQMGGGGQKIVISADVVYGQPLICVKMCRSKLR